MYDIGKVLEREYAQVFVRYKNTKKGSSTTEMFVRTDGVERKLMEEAFEVTLASTKNEGTKRQVSELADLMYAAVAYMVQNKITLEELAQEMAKRQK